MLTIIHFKNIILTIYGNTPADGGPAASSAYAGQKVPLGGRVNL